MKKTILSFSLLIIMAVGVARASGTELNEKVFESFKKEFAGISVLKWTDLGEYIKATFILGGHRTEAYFAAEDGEFLGTARDVFFSELPLNVIKTIDQNYAGADEIVAREISNAEGTHYKITLEQGKKKFKVSVSVNGYITGKMAIK